MAAGCGSKFRRAASASGCARARGSTSSAFAAAIRSQFSLYDFALKDEAIRARHAAQPLVDGELALREGLIVRVALGGAADDIVGYRAIKNGDVIDVDRPRGYAASDFWEPIRARADGG